MAKLHELTLETLGKMDGGRIATAFDLALKRCIQDCEDRPNVNKPREITIKLGVLPAAGPEDDVCDRVRMQCVIHDTVPKRQTRVYSAMIKHGGRAAVNDDSLDDVTQGTLFDGEGNE